MTRERNKPSFPISLFLETCHGSGRLRRGSHRWLLQDICCLSLWGCSAKGQYCICKALLALEMHLEKCNHALCICYFFFFVQRKIILGYKKTLWREVSCIGSCSVTADWANPLVQPGSFALDSKAADSGELSTGLPIFGQIMGRDWKMLLWVLLEA